MHLALTRRPPGLSVSISEHDVTLRDDSHDEAECQKPASCLQVLKLRLIHRFWNCQENSRIWMICFSCTVLERKKKPAWHLVLALSPLGEWTERYGVNEGG